MVNVAGDRKACAAMRLARRRVEAAKVAARLLLRHFQQRKANLVTHGPDGCLMDAVALSPREVGTCSSVSTAISLRP